MIPTTISQFNHQQDVASRQPAREAAQAASGCAWCGSATHINCGPNPAMYYDREQLAAAYRDAHRLAMATTQKENVALRKLFQEVLDHIKKVTGMEFAVWPELGEWMRVDGKSAKVKAKLGVTCGD